MRNERRTATTGDCERKCHFPPSRCGVFGRLSFSALILFAFGTLGGQGSRAAEEKHYTIATGRADESHISTDGKWIAYRKDSSEVWVAKRTDLSYRRMVSVSTDGTPPSPVGVTRCAVISGNGRYVAFISGTRFCQNDPIGGQKSDRAYLHDRDSDGDGVFDEPGGTRTMLASHVAELIHNEKYYITISSNGQVVAFSNSYAGDGQEVVWRQGGTFRQTDQYLTSLSGNGNLCAYNGALNEGSPNATIQVLMRMSMAPGPGSCISTNSDSVAANGQSERAAFSPDGNHLAFYSKGSNLTLKDKNANNWDVFLKDLSDGSVVRCSTGIDGTGDAHTQSYYGRAAVSEGGRFVAFVSDSANLVPNVTTMNDRIFLYDTATSSTFICSLASADFAWSPSISGDGRYLVYTLGNNVYLLDRGEDYATRVETKIENPASSATLESNAHGVRVDFEPGTFREPVLVELTAEILALKSPFQLGGSSMGVGMVGGATRPGAVQRLASDAPIMDKPYKITFSYLDQDLGALRENNLALYCWNASQNEWVKEPTSAVDTVGNEITAFRLGAATWCAMAVPAMAETEWRLY